MKKIKVANIPGDGVGQEVLPSAVSVLEAVSSIHGGLEFEFINFPWGCKYYLKHGKIMSEDGIDQLKDFDSILLGAVGDKELVPDHVSLWGLLLKIRREMEQVINVRPAKTLKGIKSPLINPNNFDLIVVRE